MERREFALLHRCRRVGERGQRGQQLFVPVHERAEAGLPRHGQWHALGEPDDSSSQPQRNFPVQDFRVLEPRRRFSPPLKIAHEVSHRKRGEPLLREHTRGVLNGGAGGGHYKTKGQRGQRSPLLWLGNPFEIKCDMDHSKIPIFEISHT